MSVCHQAFELTRNLSPRASYALVSGTSRGTPELQAGSYAYNKCHEKKLLQCGCCPFRLTNIYCKDHAHHNHVQMLL